MPTRREGAMNYAHSPAGVMNYTLVERWMWGAGIYKVCESRNRERRNREEKTVREKNRREETVREKTVKEKTGREETGSSGGMV